MEAVYPLLTGDTPVAPGESAWIEQTAQRLGLASTLRSRGRPQVRFLDEASDNES